MLSGKISVATGFQTSVNIAYDLNNDDKVRDFIPTQSSLDIIEDVLLSTATNSVDRARILIGAYGRGKSHIILVLLALLANKNKFLFTKLLAKMKEGNTDLYNYTTAYFKGKQKLLPIVIRGSSSNLSSSFLNTLQLTLSEEELSDVMPETHFQAAINTIESWKNEFPTTYKSFTKEIGQSAKSFISALAEYDVATYERFDALYPRMTSGSTFNPFLGFDVVDLYENVTKKLKKKGYNGIYVVYDEFSKYLESSIANATINDVKLLQDFAEKCNRSGETQMHLLLICHKDIANYIDEGLPKAKVDGWRGVSGRFKHVNLHNNYAQMYEIISEVIKKDTEFWLTFKKKNSAHFGELSERFIKNRLLDSNNASEVNDAVFGCYPLHPISTFILPRLSERVAQNERTLFTFLSSEDRHTLSAFLRSVVKDKFPLVTPDYIYDYFELLLKKEPYTSEVHKLYKLTATVLQKVESNSLEAKILKTIALIYLVEQFEKLSPTVDIISDTFRDTVTDSKIINTALESLIDKDCVVYLKRSNGYLRIKESSGVDVITEVASLAEKRRAVRSVSDILNESAFDSFMYPTSYNDEYEITRYFDFTFIGGKEFLEIEDFETRLTASNADGIIYAVIPNTISELKKLEISAKKLSSDRVIAILPTECVHIEKDAFDYEAAKTLRGGVSEDEPVLADEYDIFIDDLTEVIGKFISDYARPENGKAKYFYKGKQQKISRKAQLSGLISSVCTTVFSNTPIINNEQINKNSITSQTLNSRTKILSGLLDKDLKPNLGLIGTGQEVSIMRSILVQTDVLTTFDDNPKINLEPEDPKMKNLLGTIQVFFTEVMSVGEISFKKLYDRLTLPEYGIGLKKGIIPIYLAVVLHQNEQNLVIKHGNKETRLTADLLNGINEKPSEYSVIIENWNSDKAAYISSLEEIFKEYIIEREKTYNGFAYIVSAMSRWYMALPKYAKEFKSESLIYIKFVNSLKFSDENSREYLFEKLPKIFGVKKVTAKLADSIKATKTEYDGTIQNLISNLSESVKSLFSKRKGVTLGAAVSDWYEKLNEQTLKRLFANNENHILNLLSAVGNDEPMFVQRLAKAVSGLRIEDWICETMEDFLHDLTTFKETVDEYNKRKPSKSNEGGEYKIEFVDVSGEKVIRTFEKAEFSDTAELMLGEVSRIVDEYNHAISEQEKRQVLIEILEQLCLGEA